MASSLSKRHQARNEKALQELIKSVPGNDRCADCSARNPGWASWSLGIFLCMRCAALHRKLGTHISKVKSLSMDSWSSDQVETMRKTGNVASNKIYNPHNTKPKVPLDADEVDSAMERFIRQKYEQKAYAEGAAPIRAATVQAYTGYSRENSKEMEDQPPTPPPKPGKRFGFGLRSVSSALPLSRNKEKDNTRKASANGKMFGATIGVTDEGMQWKLVTLREMGFPDEQRNSSVLKGLNGDLERAIESLVRLGEGVPGAVGTPTSSHFSSGVNTPQFAESRSQGSNIGASVQKSTSPTFPAPAAFSQSQFANHTVSSPSSSHSYNPFENIQPVPAPQQQQQSQPQPQQRSLDQAMPNLNLGLSQQQPQQQSQQQPQPLFPNTTGGYPNSQDQVQQMRLQQSMTPPPVPQISQQFFNNPYAQQQQSYNPFFNNTQPQPPQTSQNTFNPFFNQQAQSSNFGSANPFFNQQSNNINAVLSQPMQAQQQPAQQSFHQPLQQPRPQWMNQPTQNSPTHFSQSQYFPATQQQPQQQQQPQPQVQQQQQQPWGNMAVAGGFQQQMQPLQAQPTGRADKSSILALYNYPQLAPQQPQHQSIDTQQEPSTKAAVLQPSGQVARMPRGVTGGAQRSATMPVSGSKNPFARSPIPNMMPPTENSHGLQDSIDSGRHSPDAFASLSARYVR